MDVTILKSGFKPKLRINGDLDMGKKGVTTG